MQEVGTGVDGVGVVEIMVGMIVGVGVIPIHVLHLKCVHRQIADNLVFVKTRPLVIFN